MISPNSINIYALPSLPLKLAQNLPTIPALYFCTSNDQILYIGITSDLNNRWKAHHKTIQLLRFNNVHIHYLAIAPDWVNPDFERQFIDHWEPLLNGRTEIPPQPRFNYEILWQLAPDKQITGDCWRVFICLLCKLDFDNFVLVPQPEIAEHLDITRQRVSYCIRVLVNKSILERGKRIGNMPTFRLNPSLAWKGEVTNLKLALHHKLTLAVDNTSNPPPKHSRRRNPQHTPTPTTDD